MSPQLFEAFEQLVFLYILSIEMVSFLHLEFSSICLSGKEGLYLFLFVCKIGLRMAVFYAVNGPVSSVL